MSPKARASQRGVSLIVVMALVAMLGIGASVILSVVQGAREQAMILRAVGARDRIWGGIQSMALMPASVRNSARALRDDGITAMNPELRLCLNGDMANACVSGRESSFAMYSPMVFILPDGRRFLPPMSGAAGGADVVRWSTSGRPACDPAVDAGCFFIVTTSFVPTCGPAPLPAVMPADPLNPNLFAPRATCTVADIVEVRFTVDVDPDPAIRRAHPYLDGMAPKTGVGIVSVKAATGNDPQ